MSGLPPVSPSARTSTPPTHRAAERCQSRVTPEDGFAGAEAVRLMPGPQQRRLHLAGPAPAGLRPQLTRQQLAERVLDGRFAQDVVTELLNEAANGAPVQRNAPACRDWVLLLETAQRHAVSTFAQALPERDLRDLAAMREMPLGRLLFDKLPNLRCFTQQQHWYGLTSLPAQPECVHDLAAVLQQRLLRPEAQMLLEPLLRADCVWSAGGPSMTVEWARLMVAEYGRERIAELLAFLDTPLGQRYTCAIVAANAACTTAEWQGAYSAQAAAVVERLRAPR